MADLVRLTDRRTQPRPVSFSRLELKRLLAVYSERVADGEWRDYAIDHRPGMAAFAIFRHSFEWPLFVIAKFAEGGSRQEAFAVFSGPRKLVEGPGLDEVLAVFRRPVRAVS